MKKQLLIVMMLGTCVCALNTQARTIVSENYGPDVFRGVEIQMPGYRSIASGTKIVVKYDNSVPAELRGAFDYAVRIWEEVLPISLPIKIDVKYSSFIGSYGYLSKVAYENTDYNGDLVNMYSCPSSMVKGVVMQEYIAGSQHSFSNLIGSTDFFNGTDITITYNKDMLSEIDFSLDGDIDSSKYDFVTVALRDIAIGLGFTSSYVADNNNNTLTITGERKTPFESIIANSLGTDDPHIAYTNATKGSLSIPITPQAGMQNLNLYAPKTWEQGKSLRFFIPDDSSISKLLTHDFGKGYIMRDLTATDWNSVFYNALGWRKQILTGNKPGTISTSGTTEDKIPFHGKVTLGFNSRSNIKSNLNDSNRYQVIYKNLDINEQSTNLSDLELMEYCKKYDPSSPSGPLSGDVTLSILKNDGSWDCVYRESADAEITINIDNLELHFNEDEYARGTTGGLRYRLTKCYIRTDKLHGGEYADYNVRYFTRDYTPAKPLIKFSKVQETKAKIAQMNTSSTGTDNQFIDIEVGLANIEGADRVVVEQLDEGEVLPFQYDAEDFRKGYFEANVDKKAPTKFTVIAYNSNGYKRSETIEVPPVRPDRNLSFMLSGDTIYILGITDDEVESGNFYYKFYKQNYPSSGLSGRNQLKSTQIYYPYHSFYPIILTIYEGNDIIATYKFTKQR